MPMRDQIDQQVQREIQKAMADANRAIQGAAQAPSPAIDPNFAIDVLRGEVSATRAQIDQLTAQLTSGISDAQREQVTGRLDQATARLGNLEARLDQVLTGATGGSTTQPSRDEGPPPLPEGVKDISIWFFLTCAVTIVSVAIIRPWARWLDRRGHAPPPGTDASPRLERMEQALEAVAIEVERISEGQRYTNKLMSEARALPAAAPQEAWPAKAQREPVPLRREGESA